MRPGFAILPAVLLAVLVPSASAGAPAAEKPNILWIIMDDVGAELPCYGEKAIQTPNIDRLVREGVKFDRAFLTASVCSPSRSAMITGMYQTTIGAHHHRSGRGTVKIHLPAGVEPVPAIFQRAGYFTCNGDYPAKRQGKGKTDYNFEWDPKMYDGNDWSGRKPGQPFFAQIQLWGGKNRNDNGRWYREVAPKALGTLTKPEDVNLPLHYPRDPVLLEDWAQYLDCIRYCDLQVGEILQRLENEGILDQTLIIFMGDNGISHARGKQFLYDEGIRTPFIVRGPGIGRGTTRTDLIEHIDMAAISLVCAGLPVPSWMQGRDVFAKDYQKRDAVFAARDRCDVTVDRIRSVRTEQFKYIRNFYPSRPMLQPSAYKDAKPTVIRLRELHAKGTLSPLHEELLFSPTRPKEELYDVTADPFETRNLTNDPQHRSTLETMRARLDRWMVETRDPGPESEEAYDASHAYELKNAKSQAQRDAMIKNSAETKQWVKEISAKSGNPILPGWYADPEGVVFGDRFWIYPTYSAPYDQQVFFDAFSSPDLVTWTKHSRILDTNAVTWARRAMWAPSIIEQGGRYFLFFGANDIQNDRQSGGIGVAVADQPEGPFKDYLGKPLIDRFHNGAQPIDQFVFRDHDGRHYLIYGGWRHCNIGRLRNDFRGFDPFPDGAVFKEITPQGYVEGPFMFRRNGKYYFMWSEGGWTGPDYSVAYAIAGSPLGPFKRIGRILQQDPQVATGAGHHSVIQVPGGDTCFIVYHRRPLGETDGNHRVTCIDRMEFDEQGFIKPVRITFGGVERVSPQAPRK